MLSVAKKTKAQAAAAGTKADPKRDERMADKASAKQVAATAKVSGERESWYVPALDEANLSAREQLTKRMFTTVQVVLCLVLVATFASMSLTSGGLSAEGLQALFTSNPASAVGMLAACVQPFIAYLLRLVYRHYVKGDAGYAAANLIALLCAEMALQSMVGIIAMALLLWRVWRRGAEGLAGWRENRRVGGVLADLSGSIVVLVLAVVCLFASMRIGA